MYIRIFPNSNFTVQRKFIDYKRSVAAVPIAATHCLMPFDYSCQCKSIYAIYYITIRISIVSVGNKKIFSNYNRLTLVNTAEEDEDIK